MRSWKICEQCPHCNYANTRNAFKDKLYECTLATSEEDSYSYCCKKTWLELEIPIDCEFKFEQIIMSQKSEDEDVN